MIGKISFLFFFVSVLLAHNVFTYTEQADLAGTWYPDNKEELSAQINTYLNQAHPPPILRKIIGIIAPHAGLEFSGQIAAYSYKAASKNRDDIDTVILIGFNHRARHKGIAVSNAESYQTPLGTTKINRDITKKLIKYHQNIYGYQDSFQRENSTELQIPFIQKTFPESDLVVIHIGNQTKKNCKILSDALYTILKDKENFLIVGSSDMSHFLSNKKAIALDKYTSSLITKFDPELFYKESKSKTHSLMCGYGAIYTTLDICKRLEADTVTILKYTNSGEITGHKNKVVGYLSAVISKTNTGKKKKIKGENNMGLTKEEKKTLLNIAKKTLQNHLTSGKIPEFNITSETLKEKRGAFVTLKKKGQLRGCIGDIVSNEPLYLTVRNMTIEAARNDPRFPEVTKEELEKLNIEISILSPLKKVTSPDEIILGKHGVIIKKGYRSGVFLPQVAEETGWSKEEFLSHLCMQKAGLEPDAWQNPDETDIFIFTAEVFSEEDLN